jgi:hypothetical protein
MVTAILAFYLVYVAGISRGNLGQACTCSARAVHAQWACTEHALSMH